jgi:hypothetical protein
MVVLTKYIHWQDTQFAGNFSDDTFIVRSFGSDNSLLNLKCVNKEDWSGFLVQTFAVDEGSVFSPLRCKG